jgi:glycine cleavage system T protein
MANEAVRFAVDWSEVDPDTFQLQAYEDQRQLAKINLIAAVSICPQPVRQALASSFGNIDAEGYPPLRLAHEELAALRDLPRQMAYYSRYADSRYNMCTENANIVEVLAQRRMAALFASERAPAGEIFVNVQPPSGAIANLAVFDALLVPGDRIVSMALPDGGHLTHGSEFHRSAGYYAITSYGVDPQTGKLDYDALAALVRQVQPRLLIAGASSYPWSLDWARLRAIIDDCAPDTYLMADIAHPAGLVAAGLFPNPLGCADVTTLVTYKTLCGPRGAAIMTTDERLAHQIDRAVFPRLLGAPIFQNVLAMAVALQLAGSAAFRAVQRRIVENAQALAAALQQRGIPVAYGGTETHLVVVDLNRLAPQTRYPLKGEVAARILDHANIICNKNTIPGDISSAGASGLRFGTTWVSQLGMTPAHMQQLAALIQPVLQQIEPFVYAGLRVDSTSGKTSARLLPRGKIPYAILQETQAAATSLLRQVQAAPAHDHARPSARRPPAAPTLNGDQAPANSPPALTGSAQPLGLLLISGERALPFLQAAGTANLFDLPFGTPRRTRILDEQGATLGASVVFRLAPDDLQQDRLLVALPACRAAVVQPWLQALSDGYVFFGHTDALAKVDGPVLIETLSPSAEMPAAYLVVSGAQAADLLDGERALLDAADEQWRATQLGSSPVRIAAFASGSASPIYVFATDREHLQSLAAWMLGQWPARELVLCDPPLDAPISPARAADDAPDLRKPFWLGADAARAPAPKPAYLFADEEATQAPQRSPLHALHREVGARLTTFAGWELPLWYTRIWDEYCAVRQTAALFDVSHMGILEITGAEATWFLDAVTTNYVPALRVGQGSYSFILDPDGAVIDDCYLYRLAPQRYLLVVNAVNATRVTAWLRAVAARQWAIDPEQPGIEVLPTATIRDLKDPAAGADQRADLALQGPNALRILQALADSAAVRRRLAALRRNAVIEERLAGCDLIISRTGYTGEKMGFELYVHPAQATELWRRLLDAGAHYGLKPAGLGARDAARIEAGFPLHGHELAGPDALSPIAAGYGAFVKFHKLFFIGRRALLRSEAQRTQEIVRFQAAMPGNRVIRAGNPLIDAAGVCIGYVTSSTVLHDRQIGLAYIDSAQALEGAGVGIYALGEGNGRAVMPLGSAPPDGARMPPAIAATILSRW